MPELPPRPSYFKLIAGNPGERPLNKNELNHELCVPIGPDHLSDEAKAAWDQIAADLNAIDLLTQVDRSALARFPQTVVDGSPETHCEPIAHAGFWLSVAIGPILIAIRLASGKFPSIA